MSENTKKTDDVIIAKAKGRRRGERHERVADARLRLAGETEVRGARIRDLSFTGLSLVSAVRVPNGTAIRVTADTFDTVAITVGCRAASPVFTVHARLLTLQLLRDAVSASVCAGPGSTRRDSGHNGRVGHAGRRSQHGHTLAIERGESCVCDAR